MPPVKSGGNVSGAGRVTKGRAEYLLCHYQLACQSTRALVSKSLSRFGTYDSWSKFPGGRAHYVETVQQKLWTDAGFGESSAKNGWSSIRLGGGAVVTHVVTNVVTHHIAPKSMSESRILRLFVSLQHLQLFLYEGHERVRHIARVLPTRVPPASSGLKTWSYLFLHSRVHHAVRRLHPWIKVEKWLWFRLYSGGSDRGC